MKQESNHTDLMDLMLENRRRPDHSIFFSTEIRSRQFVFIAERVRWNEARDEHVTESTHVFTPSDFSKRWRALERLGWKVVGTRKPRAMKFNSFRREVSRDGCACHPTPKLEGKAIPL
jgi:hypothetical protein